MTALWHKRHARAMPFAWPDAGSTAQLYLATAPGADQCEEGPAIIFQADRLAQGELISSVYLIGPDLD